MKSTGDYGKPVLNMLEGMFEVLLVDAQHVRLSLGARPISKMPPGWHLLQQGVRQSFAKRVGRQA
jgi:hypothetical protein